MNCNILVVDDSKIIRAAIRKIAKVAGVPEDRIFEAGHGQEALDLLENTWVDLILLDINMPVMDGETFVAEKAKRPEFADIPVFIVSTEANEERLQRMRDMGVRGSLRKPFEPEDLCQAITDVIGAKA
ncbi:MAG: response regulator [Phycisphaerales bacterium]